MLYLLSYVVLVYSFFRKQLSQKFRKMFIFQISFGKNGVGGKIDPITIFDATILPFWGGCQAFRDDIDVIVGEVRTKRASFHLTGRCPATPEQNTLMGWIKDKGKKTPQTAIAVTVPTIKYKYMFEVQLIISYFHHHALDTSSYSAVACGCREIETVNPRQTSLCSR